jgi:hypothetical protein
MKKYQYQIVSYIHDRVTSEFVNIGIVVFNPESSYLKSKFITKYGRISQFFNEINGHALLSTLKQIEKCIIKKAKEPISSKNLEEITNSILAKNDGAITFSGIYYGVDVEFDAALEGLFERMINKYTDDHDKQIIDDHYVWKNVYKQYFDKYDITRRLKPHAIKTSHDDIKFDKAWKNEIWHCYEPVSFDLKQIDTIKNKIYKWSGILSELEKSNEEMHLYFLTRNPSIHKSVIGFIDDTFLQRASKLIQVSLINESQAEEFALSVSKEITEHQEPNGE